MKKKKNLRGTPMRFKLSYRTSASKPAVDFGYVNHYGKTFTFDINHFVMEDLPKWLERVYKHKVRAQVKLFMKDTRQDQQNYPTRYESSTGIEIQCREWLG